MSTVKVNTVDKRTGSTLTLGGCGTTVTLGAGATQSGFGRTGTVDWCTTAKTAPFTGVSGKGYFVNTTCGAVTVTLPASPSAGDIISVADYASTFQTNNLTICNNGSKINGECATAKLSTQGQSITLVYVDSTKGWKNTMDSTSDVSGVSFITATGGTITTCGDYKIHTFTADGCFSVSNVGSPNGSTTVDYLVIAGGASGGGNTGGGGGAGGYRESFPNPAIAGLPVSVQTYPITVGGGGTSASGLNTQGNPGTNSIFSTITAAGGGGGGARNCTQNGIAGGSGGGGTYPGGTGGTGNTPPTSPVQGYNGGNGNTCQGAGGGGGGGSQIGQNSSTTGPQNGGNGGNGVTSTINGSPVTRAGGGGGGVDNVASGGTGGSGGGGAGATLPSPVNGTAGTANTGGGGGGGSPSGVSGTGGSGIVIIRYKYQ
jgi:hypothetical protein